MPIGKETITLEDSENKHVSKISEKLTFMTLVI